jgi:hypothetical protein
MTFDDLLAQGIEVLRREGRVSYRALKRRFALRTALLPSGALGRILAVRGGNMHPNLPGKRAVGPGVLWYDVAVAWRAMLPQVCVGMWPDLRLHRITAYPSQPAT